jgi:RNA polymerase sigma factor (sigma-70 family)
MVHTQRVTAPAVRTLLDLSGDAARVSDAELLDRFVASQDSGAYAALVQRHGPMVLGVCQRLLTDAHDQEDAYQAAFLLLLHKAKFLQRPEFLANWLHGIACGTAQHARDRAACHQTYKTNSEPSSTSPPYLDAAWQDLCDRFDAELHHVADEYRITLITCYLEGRTFAEASSMLGWPIGVLTTRLMHARKMLRQRLVRRDSEVPGALFPFFLAQRAGPVAVPPPLLETTVLPARALAAGKDSLAAGLIAPAVRKLMEANLRTESDGWPRWLRSLSGGLKSALLGYGWAVPALPEPAVAIPPRSARPMTQEATIIAVDPCH